MAGNLKNGRGASWARDILTKNGFKNAGTRLLLLTQPRMFGRVFNPVSFWLAFRDDELIAVIAEVSTPFGDRHSYLCNLPDFSPIEATSQLTATKALHVSPFQDIEGDYEFRLIYDVIVSLFALFIAMGAKASWPHFLARGKNSTTPQFFMLFFAVRWVVRAQFSSFTGKLCV